MSARAMWKGEIVRDDFRLPVKLYAAVEDQSIRFHLLHDQDQVRIRQRMVNPETDETVEPANTRKGLQLSRHEFVILEDDDLASLQPEPSRDIEIHQFLPADELDHQWYDRPYWLGPDGDADSYFAFAQALGDESVAVVRWVMRNKEYRGAIGAASGYLSLMTLRHAEEMIPASELEPPQGRAFEKQELNLARQLLKALEGEFEPTKFRDAYRKRVHELIEAKSEGKTIKVEEFEEKPTTRSLAESLRASLKAV